MQSHQVTIDFTGSDPQVQGAINAVEAITYSACFYVFRCLLREDVPATSGLMRPIRVIAPSGTVVNAKPPAAVAGGNVETSQRIVDVLLKALAQAIPDRIPAAASGTMNNLTIGGIDPPLWRAFCLLRNHRRWHGRAPYERRSLRRPHPHDQLAEHSRRGSRIRLPDSPAAIFFALQEWRHRPAHRWRRNRP